MPWISDEARAVLLSGVRVRTYYNGQEPSCMSAVRDYEDLGSFAVRVHGPDGPAGWLVNWRHHCDTELEAMDRLLLDASETMI